MVQFVMMDPTGEGSHQDDFLLSLLTLLHFPSVQTLHVATLLIITISLLLVLRVDVEFSISEIPVFRNISVLYYCESR